MTRSEAKEIAILALTPKTNPCGETALGDFELVEFHIVSESVTSNAWIRWEATTPSS